jgi:pseudaminic acid synthase
LEEVNLNTIPLIREKFGVQVGLSDHTLGYSVPMGAVALGAVLIEKHFIMDRSIGGPDSAFSMEPSEFEQMISNVREVEKAMGVATLELSVKSAKNRDFARSLYIVSDMAKGETFSKENIRSIRPGFGLSPKHLKDIIGKKAITSLEKGTPVSWDIIE